MSPQPRVPPVAWLFAFVGASLGAFGMWLALPARPSGSSYAVTASAQQSPPYAPTQSGPVAASLGAAFGPPAPDTLGSEEALRVHYTKLHRAYRAQQAELAR